MKFSNIETSIKNVVHIDTFWSRAKFRTELKPLLGLKANSARENWYMVTTGWFSAFTNSINLNNSKPNDSWEFPARIPIETSSMTIVPTVASKLLHSKAWDMLLAFNGLYPGSIPNKRQSYLNQATNMIEVPIHPTKHKCTIGHNDGNNKFSFECEIKTFPYETYEDVLEKLSGFSTLFTKYQPIIYSFDNTNLVSCNTPQYTQYRVINNKTQIRSPPSGYGFSTQLQPPVQSVLKPIHDLTSQIRIGNEAFLVIIPDSLGNSLFQVIPK